MPQDTEAQELPAEDGNEGTTEAAPEQAAETSFTQTEVNAINARTKRDAKRAAESALFESLGVKNAAELKAKFSKADELEQASLSDLEKAQQKAELAEANHAALRAEIDKLKAAQKADTQRNFLVGALGKAGATDTANLFVLLRTNDAEKITALFAEGTPSEADVKKFVNAAQDSYSLYFKTANGGSPSTQGGLPPTSRQHALEEAQKHIRNRVTR